MPDDPMPDRMGPYWIFSSMMVAIISKLVTIAVVARLLLTMLWRKTLDKLVDIVENDHP